MHKSPAKTETREGEKRVCFLGSWESAGTERPLRVPAEDYLDGLTAGKVTLVDESLLNLSPIVCRLIMITEDSQNNK